MAAPDKRSVMRETLAALEHEQWIEWSKTIANVLQKYTGDPDVKAHLERWEQLWVPYADLTEEQKDQDRVWADKILVQLEACAIDEPPVV